MGLVVYSEESLITFEVILGALTWLLHPVVNKFLQFTRHLSEQFLRYVAIRSGQLSQIRKTGPHIASQAVQGVELPEIQILILISIVFYLSVAHKAGLFISRCVNLAGPLSSQGRF